MSLKVGDRVQINYGHGWDGPGTVLDFYYDADMYLVRLDGKSRGAFKKEHLTLIDDPQPKVAENIKVKSDLFTFDFAKIIAVELAKKNYLNLVTIDDVQQNLAESGFNSVDLGNAAGALFRNKNWVKQSLVKSTRKGNRRMVAVWKYVGK